MTVSNSENKVFYTGNGVATTFAIPFHFLDTGHLKVFQMSNGVQTERTDWTVSGGNLVFDVAPSSNSQFVIIRKVPFTQETDYRENEVLPAETLERNLDKLTMQVQQLKEQADRAVTMDLFSDAEPSVLVGKIEALYDIRNQVAALAENIAAIVSAFTNIAAIQNAPTQAANAAASAETAAGYANSAHTDANAAAVSAGASASSATTSANSAAASAGSANSAAASAEQAAAYVPSVVGISATSGTVSLSANSLYKMTISAATTFSLPSNVNASIHNQIKVLVYMPAVVSVNFGTTHFFNAVAPDLSVAGYYDFYFDYDPMRSVWVAGVIRKG